METISENTNTPFKSLIPSLSERSGLKRRYTLFTIHFSLLVFLCSSSFVHAQYLSVFDVDTSSFPTVKAKFYASDAAGNQISGLSTGDLIVTEDGAVQTVTRISCPPASPPVALSSVLTIDISGSMSGNRLQSVKVAAQAWVNALPLDRSECALSTFNNRSYLNQDFTADRSLLLSAITALSASGTTDYDEALLTPPAGALEVTKRGKNKKVIVFLSDGMPNNPPNQSAILAEAQRQNATIYAIILGIAAPQEMKDLCSQTGGLCLENITTVQEAEAAYRRILQTALGGIPCELEWTSDGCEKTRMLVVSLPAYGLQASVSYSIPYTSLSQLMYIPSRSLRFGEVTPGTTKTMQLTLTAQGKSARIDRITSNNPLFKITDYGGGVPPFILGSGRSQTLTVEYAPIDSSYSCCLFKVEGDVCEGNSFYADGGWIGKKLPLVTIKVTRPNGGEHLVAGSEEELTWEGVMPEEKVQLEYSTDAGNSWMLITDTATGLRYTWRVLKTPSISCLLRATVKPRRTFVADMALIPAGTFRMGDLIYHPGGPTNEHPVHEVTITMPFLMGRTEVTQAQWIAVMGNNPSYFKDDSLPVEQVSWYDAVEFCNRLSKSEGLDTCYSSVGANTVCDFTASGYRLPTEAEWEYACRGGTETDFYTGNMTSRQCSPLDQALDRAGWYCGNENTRTRHVGQKEPNVFGLYDMHGNVAEWCWDWFSSTYYTENPVTDPRGPETAQKYRILRGSSWGAYANCCRSAYRYSEDPKDRHYKFGFRLARTY